MNLFELFVKIGVKDEASGTISKITSGLGKGLATAAKIGTAAVGAAATGIAALTKSAVDNYAEYEQLVGGVETLFKNNADNVIKYAENAYMTAGMSANEYMSTVTGFSASLLQGLGGDTKKAAEIANLAVTDMADNANKMGTSMELIQNAYQGFAKDNFTMLDNLKLGYGGTAGEMARLINDSGVLGNAIEVTNKTVADVPFDKVIEAINVIQTRMGITGTTAKEAGATIAGSIGAMKSAWSNLVTGLANGNADIGKLVDNLVTTIVGNGTESNLGVLGNILPAVQRVLVGAGKLIEGAIPVLVEVLPGLLEKIIPVLISSATSLVDAVITVLPELVDLIVNALIENAPKLIVAAIKLIAALAGGLLKNVPNLLAAIPQIIGEVVKEFIGSENLKRIRDVGKNIVEGLKEGIKNAWNNMVDWFKGLFDDIIGIAKKILGIASPSKVFKKIGGFTAEGFGAGFEDEFSHVKDDMEDALNFDDASVGINASIRKVGAGAAGGAFGGTTFNGDIIINVNGDKYHDENALADALALKLQGMTDRRAAVYA